MIKFLQPLFLILLPFTLPGQMDLSMNETSLKSLAETDTTLESNMIEAELGKLGEDFSVVSVDGAEAITINSDWINSLNPGSADRVATYLVHFDEPGTYELFARVRVGPASWDDDSQFIPNGFGIKDPFQDTAWFRVNGLASAGYTEASALVDGGGSAPSGVWKWINLSQFAEGTGPKTYTVTEDSLTRILQIGARENGL
ncbi:MAG: hypothetical protein P8100_15530 [bacterium]